MASFLRLASRSAPPAMAAAALVAFSSSNDDDGEDGKLTSLLSKHLCSPFTASSIVHCEVAPLPSNHRVVNQVPVTLPVELSFDNNNNKNDEAETTAAASQPIPPKVVGFQKDAPGYFYDTLPNSQIFQPKYDWPMWDTNWDDREPMTSTTRNSGMVDGDDTTKQLERRKKRYLRKHGVTRHIILVRHGQYDETHKEDEKRILTEMGREQALETGKRIAEMIRGADGDPNSPCHVKIVRVSNLARAKETADLLASQIPEVERAEPDPLLNEGSPAHTIPSGGKPSPARMERIQEGHERIEEAFRKHFYRADEIDMPDDDYFIGDPPKKKEAESPPDPASTRHEYEIIVCHANVIRYFMCRALQLPPEAWLRLCTFNCSLTYFTIRPTGGVSCRMLGDIGHLPPKLVSFSGHHGFNW